MRNSTDRTLAEKLFGHVDRLASVIGPRHVGEPRSLAAAAQFVEGELANSGYRAERQTYAIGDHEVANIVAELSGGSRKDEVVVVGAHYDTVATTPGADDNASAVAVLIEAARQMRRRRPARTVRFIGFTCEEKPHCHSREMGSQVYACRCRERGERIAGMLCLEMVGYYSAEPASQRVPDSIPRFLHGAFPRRGDFLAAVGNLRSWRLLWKFRSGFKRTVQFPLYSIALPESIREIRRSDNSSFWDQGYEALMLTDTSFLRNPHYHQPADTPETLDYRRMADVTHGVVGGLMNVAGDDENR